MEFHTYIKNLKELIFLEAFKTPIDGLVVFKLDVHEDERGFFKENFNQRDVYRAVEKILQYPDDERYLNIIANFNPVQNNVSYNHAGVVRGLHAEPWNKYISVASGSVHGAWIDLRPEGFAKVYEIDITPDIAVFVPKGVANGFQAYEDTTYTYLVDDYWSIENKKLYKFLNLTEIDWPRAIDWSLVSDDDKHHPTLLEKGVKKKW